VASIATTALRLAPHSRGHTGLVRHHVLPSVILASVALALTLAITVGWNVIFATHYGAAFTPEDSVGIKTGYWMTMALGDLFLATVMTAIAIVLAVTIRRSRRLHEQNAFIDRVTHELRTPIAALRLSLDTCMRRPLGEDALRSQIGEMRGDLDRLQDLVDKVIDAGRLEHRSWQPRTETVDLADVVERCRTRLCDRHELAPDAVTVSGSAPTITSDALALDHIVLNLLDNAIKYADGTPAIQVQLGQRDAAARIIVQDHGIGIPRKEIGRIFRRFHRITERPQAGGTGLGLYVVHHLCRQLGGTISAHSDGPGTGATFTVSIPLEPQ
jgi:signal transduction histidine kinase